LFYNFENLDTINDPDNFDEEWPTGLGGGLTLTNMKKLSNLARILKLVQLTDSPTFITDAR
jgi:hypothetical protein